MNRTDVVAPPSESPVGARPAKRLVELEIQRYGTILAFAAVFAVYAFWLGGKFLSADARMLDLHQNTPVLLLGLAVMTTLTVAQFDLSVAAMATLTSTLSIGLTVNQSWSFGLVLALCLAIGVVGGLLNGFFVQRLRVNAFITTLGTSGIFLGVSQVYSKGTSVTPLPEGPQLPSWFSGSGSLGDFGATVPQVVVWIFLALALLGLLYGARRRRPAGLSGAAWTATTAIGAAVVVAGLFALQMTSWVENVSWTIAVLVAIGVVLWVLFNYTTLGRQLKATGGNAEAARLAGVKTGRVTITAFVIGAVLASVAGLMLAAAQGAAAPEAGTSFLLPAFAAAFLSTVLISTGAFTVWGTIFGGIFLIWVSQGLILGGVLFTWTAIVNGVVLLLAVAIATVRRRD